MAADAQELLCSALHCSLHCTFTIFNNIFNIKLTRSLGAPLGPGFQVVALGRRWALRALRPCYCDPRNGAMIG